MYLIVLFHVFVIVILIINLIGCRSWKQKSFSINSSEEDLKDDNHTSKLHIVTISEKALSLANGNDNNHFNFDYLPTYEQCLKVKNSNLKY
jgi:hypothetical protein